MNGRSKNEHEERALDALFVSQLRWNDAEEIDEAHLPRLTDDDKAALDSLGPDFMRRLLAGKVTPSEARDGPEDPAYAEEEMLAGMNRAEDIDDDTAKELERKRREIIDRVKREEAEEQDDAD